ncbi:MAG: hypothetical protein RIC14_08065 [Filomicrobium sp.]
MRLHKISASVLAACICFVAFTNSAQATFCRSYEQTSSNAGDCPDCQLSIMNFPQEQAYAVHASNGWQAELNYVEGDSSVATGGGRWRKGLPHAYAGRDFDLDLTQQGKTLSMVMSTIIDGHRQVIRAEFRCTG